MKKVILGLILGFCSIALASEVNGYDVYKKYCSACHIENMSKEDMKRMKMMVKSGQPLPIKAPPFSEVSARLKFFYPEKEEFIKFVVDYITNPSAEKAKCMPMALKRFGVMPPIGKGMKEEEKIAVAKWLYENYNTKWENFHKGQQCPMNGQGMMMKKHKHMHGME